ncbi:MAG: hypothetical protein RR356_03235, partial [Bacteroidales bacterium]
MKNTNKVLFLAVLFAAFAINSTYAEKPKGVIRKSVAKAESATCLPANNSNELTINNVRAYLETNGTMWNKEIAQYEIPKGSGKTSMFAAALWIGGKDRNGQLKLAAVKFRQQGDDFWTGPLTLVGASVDQQTCITYDKFFKITRAQVEEQIQRFTDPTSDAAS